MYASCYIVYSLSLAVFLSILGGDYVIFYAISTTLIISVRQTPHSRRTLISYSMYNIFQSTVM